MEITLAYGDKEIKLDIPSDNLAGSIAPKQIKLISNVANELEHVMNNPHGSVLSDLASSKSVCVLVEDHTRDEPHQELLHFDTLPCFCYNFTLFIIMFIL